MEPKKISFGFSKSQKKLNILSALPPKEENKLELIKCLEGQAIKLVEEKPAEEEKQLIIPLIGSSRTSAALASLKARHDVLNGINSSQPTSEDQNNTADKPQPASDESLEQKAARELIESVNKSGQTDDGDTTTTIEIPKPDELPLEGAKESSIDDYESTPIEKFGYAMLRGMGWKDQPKKKDDNNDLTEPFVRPKGMGLGADKIAKKMPPLIPPESNEILEIKRNACVRILAGKHKDLYGMIEGFDEHAGRVIVKLALGGHYESLNEFLVQPVSKKEYAQYGKVINSAKYEEYKKLENEHGQIVLKAPKIEKHSDSETEDRKPVIKQEKYSTQATSSRRYSNEHDEKSRDRRNDHNNDRRDRVDYQVRDRRDDTMRARQKSDRRDKYDEDRRRNNDNTKRRSCSEDSRSSQSSADHRHRVKKKSSKSKKKHKEQDRDRSRERRRRSRSQDHSRQRYSSSDDEKRHKKKTKKSKRPRSRSRERKR